MRGAEDGRREQSLRAARDEEPRRHRLSAEPHDERRGGDGQPVEKRVGGQDRNCDLAWFAGVRRAVGDSRVLANRTGTAREVVIDQSPGHGG